ncbi:hypothetical protein B0H16DRAFT_1478299 [Mycena metata]|uniref:Uncharacterized protein n=1 Tax=Mycena metata TaxID=1033252 RepID=A0AAD7H7I5_9AGAR|nr:hypothetical protein B0H16DRAFT_1478299 [Mycena metata]
MAREIVVIRSCEPNGIFSTWYIAGFSFLILLPQPPSALESQNSIPWQSHRVGPPNPNLSNVMITTGHIDEIQYAGRVLQMSDVGMSSKMKRCPGRCSAEQYT